MGPTSLPTDPIERRVFFAAMGIRALCGPTHPVQSNRMTHCARRTAGLPWSRTRLLGISLQPIQPTLENMKKHLRSIKPVNPIPLQRHPACSPPDAVWLASPALR
jgi:hypothetical protein